MERRKPSPRRAADEHNTRIVNDFLDRYLYTEANGFTNLERVEDRPRQIKGVDVEFEFNGDFHRADEKAATSYINKDLATFSLELAFVNKQNEIMDGWFLNEDLMNDSYVFVWIDQGDVVPFSDESPDVEVLTGVDGIRVADVAFVNKHAIHGYLSSIGWDDDKLRTKCDRILDNPEGEKMGNVWRNGCKFSYSQHLVEQPVNVIISRTKIIEMSAFHLHFDNRE